jgi:hypothetical protein
MIFFIRSLHLWPGGMSGFHGWRDDGLAPLPPTHCLAQIRRDDPAQSGDGQRRAVLRYQLVRAQLAAPVAAVARDLQHGKAVGDLAEDDNTGGHAVLHVQEFNARCRPPVTSVFGNNN